MKKLLIMIPVIALAACGPYQLSASERQAAELGARQYASLAGGEFVSCSGQDSDKDYYVTCSIKDKATSKINELLCSYSDNATGCKQK